MKKFTKLMLVAVIAGFSWQANAQCTYYDYDFTTKTYVLITSMNGWTNSPWYNTIDIDAEKLTDPALPQHSGADGKATTANWGTGYFLTPVYNTDDQGNKTPTAVNWPVKYYLAAFAPNFYSSAFTKAVLEGVSYSGKGIACYDNNNTYLPIDSTKFYAKKGFIELSRQASAVSNTPPSRHGFIEIDSVPACERIQYQVSTTAWKRGFKVDIDYHAGKGWEPLRWLPSDIANSLSGLAERGYVYEEMIGLERDPEAIVSFRFRIWDGDSIHANPLKTTGEAFSTTMTPYAQRQVARFHQIKIYTGIVPETAPVPMGPVAGVKNLYKENGIKVWVKNGNITLSEIAPVEVFAADGTQVYKGVTDKVETSGMSKGIYIIRTKDSNNLVANKKMCL